MRDEMPIYVKKMHDVLIQPLTTEEVSAVMKICNDNLIPVTPRGAGTGLVGASVSILGGVMLDTQKMNKILEYDLENMIVRVQPGVLPASAATSPPMRAACAQSNMAQHVITSAL